MRFHDCRTCQCGICRAVRGLKVGQKERPRYCEGCGRVSPLYLESCECGSKAFTFTPPWRLTSNDRRFLRAIRIDPEHKKGDK